MNSNTINFLSATQKLLSACIFASLFSVATLSGCGGGEASTTSTENNLPSPVAGGIDGEVLVPGTPGESPTPPTELEQLPKVTVAPRQFADPNVLLNLSGTVVAAKGATIVKTLWTQVSGPQVIIPSPQELNNVILIPDVNVATQLEFRLTAQDDKDKINSSTISILVKPVPTFVKVIGGVFNRASGTAVFKLRLNAPSTTPVTISYATQDGTAQDDVDYVGVSGQTVLLAGETVKEIPVNLLYGRFAGEEIAVSFSLQATAIDGTATHANKGVVIIGNGEENRLEQTIQFLNAPKRLSVGKQFKNELNPIGLGTGSIFYSSSDSSVATINALGVVTAITPGYTTITATKLADNIYASATTSYSLLIANGTAPTVSIDPADGFSVPLGTQVNFVGTALDNEDARIPNTSMVWTRNFDDLVLTGPAFNISGLQLGTFTFTFTATDSDGNIGEAKARILMGNIAPLAKASASSTYCTEGDCYSASRVNDTSLSTALGNASSWVNDDLSTPRLPQSLALNWPSSVTINSVDVYTTKDYPIQDYDIEYLKGTQWVVAASITGNTQEYNSHPISTITTTSLRLMAKKGSIQQPQYARINEIVVFGTVPSSSSSSSSSSSLASTLQ